MSGSYVLARARTSGLVADHLGGGERLQVGPDMTAKRRGLLLPVEGRELQRFAS